MAEVQQIICDNEKCGTMKKSENHWWMTWIDDEGELHLRPMRGRQGEGVMVFCGESCAMKKVSEYMSRPKERRKDVERQAWGAMRTPKVTDLVPLVCKIGRASCR